MKEKSLKCQLARTEMHKNHIVAQILVYILNGDNGLKMPYSMNDCRFVTLNTAFPLLKNVPLQFLNYRRDGLLDNMNTSYTIIQMKCMFFFFIFLKVKLKLQTFSPPNQECSVA